jgi:hypothetical protein
MRHTHISAARSSKVRTRPANRAALALPVAWADRGASCIRFQDTKNGASTFDALDEMLRRNGWAFPAARGKGYYVSLPKVLDRLCKRAKLEGVMLHLLRHSFAATAAEMSFSELTIASLLGHTVPGVIAHHAHVPDSALVAAADRVSARIAAALDGETGKGEVIPLKPARKAENHKDTPSHGEQGEHLPEVVTACGHAVPRAFANHLPTPPTCSRFTKPGPKSRSGQIIIAFLHFSRVASRSMAQSE